MADIKNIDVFQTVSSVTFQVEPNTNIININKITTESVVATTNLTYSPSATNGVVESDTGSDATIPLADTVNAGLLSPSEKIKLTGIATGAEVNVNADWNATTGDTQILNKPSIAGLATVTYVDAQDALKQNNITLTTTGTNGASTLVGATLNIPQYSGATNLTTSQTSTNFTINSSTGDDASVPLGNGTYAGATSNDYTSAEKSKLGGISGTNTGDQNLQTVTNGVGNNTTNNSITANSFIKSGYTGTNILLDDGNVVALSSVGGNTNLSQTQTASNFTINSDTGTDAVISLGNGTLAGATLNDYTSAEKTKLAGIATGATVGVPYTGAVSDVNLGEFGIQLGNLEFDNTPTNIPTTAGSMYYNDADGTLDLKLKGGNVTLQIGQEQLVRVVNRTATSVTLSEANYQAVRLTGAQGQRLKVDLSQATTDALSAETIGLVTETIAFNQEGFVTTSGIVRGINTTGSLQSETWLDGDILYLSPTVAGRITKVKPTAPNHLIIIGYVISAHITQGTIFVKVDNGYELDELHNVKIVTPANNNILSYTTSTDIWENKTVETALGFTPYNATNPSGYQTAAQVQTIADAKVADAINDGTTTVAPSQNAVFDALALKQPLATVLTNTTASYTTADETKLDKYPSTATIGKILQGDGTNYVEINTPTGTTNLNYTPAVSNGTVTSSTGSSATIPLANGTNAGLLTAAEKTKLTNTSGSNNGDETTATIKTKLGITTLSGSNTGDQDLSSLAPKASPTFTGTITTPDIIVSNATASTIAHFDAAKNIESLPLATYPSLTELALLKGVTGSSVQTQLNNKIAKNVGTTYTTNTITTVSLAEYTAIGTKDANTLYFII